MDKYLEFFLTLLAQFAGGPGRIENNLPRFGLAAVLWAALLLIAWSRQRQQKLPREKLLLWGFGLGFIRELFMFSHVSMQMLGTMEHEAGFFTTEPFEHALAMTAIIVVAGSFLRYILDDITLARRYLWLGGAATAICYLATFWWWPLFTEANPGVKFHQTWGAWLFHVTISVLIVTAIVILTRTRGWLRNVVILALAFFFFSELLVLFNFATNKLYGQLLCPVGNTFRLLAIPLLGYVYIRELFIERELAEEKLKAYRDHLEELVEQRTVELKTSNKQLQQEIAERRQTQQALAQLSRQHELILNSAGEGIFGVDSQGRQTFANSAAARMLGYTPDELLGRSSHVTWHHSKPDGRAYPEAECPLHSGYKSGKTCRGSDQYFWRKDGTSFPVRYVSTPIYEHGELKGAVVVFQENYKRKQAEAEIARRNAQLAAQNTIAATISRSLDLDTILDTALDTVLAVLDMEIGGIFLLDPTEKLLMLHMYRGGGRALYDFAASARPLHPGECISGQAVVVMKPILLNVSDIPTERLPHFIVAEGLQTMVSIPLVSKGHAQGALTLGSPRPNAIAPQGLELLTAIGQQIGMAIENARLYRETERWAEELTLLHQVSAFLSSTLNPTKIYHQIAEQSAKLLGCQAATVLRWDEEQEEAVGVFSYGADGMAPQQFRAPPNEFGLLPDLTTRRQSITIQDSQADPRIPARWLEKFRIKALLCVPIWGTEKPLAFLLMIEQQGPRRWRPDEVELVESFVNRAAIALENAYLHKQVERAATLEERQRIAAEMHDGLAQTLSYLGHRIDQTAELAKDGHVQELKDEFQHIRHTIDQASKEVRLSIASLQEKPRPRQSLQDLLTELASNFTKDHRVPVDLISTYQDPLFLPPSNNEQIRSVVKEGLLNASRHAQAHNITIQLVKNEDKVTIIIADDGKGFDPTLLSSGVDDHFGLKIMRARAARIGGRLQVDSNPGEGTQVILTWSSNSKDTERDKGPENHLTDLSPMPLHEERNP